MADLAIVTANIRFSTNARYDQVTSGAACAQGDLLYRRAADNKWLPCDADASQAAAKAEAIAVAACAATDQPLIICRYDPDLTIGAATIAGTPYWNSVTAGKIADAKAGSTFWNVVIGMGRAANKIHFDPMISGAVVDPNP